MSPRVLLLLLAAACALPAQQTARFPAALPDVKAMPWANNNLDTKLTSTITPNSKSFTVLDPSLFKKVPTLVTIVGPAPDYTNMEIVLVCEVRGNTAHVCPDGRGFDGTAQVYHKYGDTVRGLVVSHILNQHSLELTAITTALGTNLSNVIRAAQSAGGDLAGSSFPNLVIRTVGGKSIPSGSLVGDTDTQTLQNKTVYGTFYGSLNGNASTASAADTANSVGGKSAASIAAAVDAILAATDAATVGTLAKRSAGNTLSATTFIGALQGNATTSSALAARGTQCSAGAFSTGSEANGNANCAQVMYSQLGGTPIIPSTGVSAGTYGSPTQSVQITVGADGRITGISNAAIPGVSGLTGYETVRVGSTDLTQRTMLYVGNGLAAADDPVNSWTGLSLASSGVAAGTYGNSGSVASFTVDIYGRITSASSPTISIAGTQISSGTIDNARLNAASANTPSTLVLRDGSGNFTAGTITANLVGNVTGNASTASAVAWGNVSGKPSLAYSDAGKYNLSIFGKADTAGVADSANSVAWANVSGKPSLVLNDGASYGISITGSAASATTASSVAWSGVTGKPALILNDGGTYGIHISGNANYASSAGAVAWASVSGKPTLVYPDGGTYNLSVSGNAATATGSGRWTGTRTLTFTYGNGIDPIQATSVRMPVWRVPAGLTSMTVTQVSCIVDSGSVVANLTQNLGGAVMASPTCGTSWTDASPNGSYATISANGELGFLTSSVSGSPKYVSVRVTYTPTY